MTAGDAVRLERRGEVAVLVLDRPGRRNAIDARMSEGLRAALDAFEAEDALRVAVLRAEGPSFCAGLDLSLVAGGEAEAFLFGPGRLGGFVSRARTKPVIAAVQGAALAGGFELVLACDLVVAAADARFGLPEPRVGLVAGAGGAIRLARQLPKAVAHEMLLTGEPIGAERALALGLVNRVVEPGALEAAALDLARRIAASAPLSVRASLDLARAAAEDESAWALNDRLLSALLRSDDAAEGARAFAERRAPRWTGR